MSLAVITDLAKYFGAELIFAGFSFRLEHHDRIGLVGPNGAGKSPMLKLLVGELDPDEGSISYAAGLRSGYLPQIADFHPARTLHDEMLAVFADLFALEDELHALAVRLADPALIARPEEYNTVLARYADLQDKFEHASGYTIQARVRHVLDGR